MKRMRRTMQILFLITLVSSASLSCVLPGSPTLTPTETTPLLLQRGPDLRGIITKIYSQGQNTTGLYVEGKKEADTSYDKAQVSITNDTRIFNKQQGEYVMTATNQLRVGQVVEVLFVGPVLTSDPVQANAQEIAIVK